MSITTVYADLPTTVPGFAKNDPVTDHVTIVLNARLSHERNVQTYLHEVSEHINKGDFDSREDADSIELRAHK